MTRSTDVIIVGGGVTGATLAYVLARAGVDVCLLEKQETYRDRAQGEAMMPWGAAEARALGLLDRFREQGAALARVYSFDVARDRAEALASPELVSELFPGVPGVIGIGHPRLTTAMMADARAAGARVLLGAQVSGVAPPLVHYTHGGRTHTVRAPVIVGADGKTSRLRGQLGFELRTMGPHATCVGMLAAGLGDDVPRDAVSSAIGDAAVSIVFPQGGGRARLYHMFGDDVTSPYRGRDRAQRFLADFAGTCMPWGPGVAAARRAGPCAAFAIHDAWVEHPARPGVVLIGDAAGFSSPVCAQGIAVCMRDVRLVSEALLGGAPRGGALFDRYLADRAQRMARLRTVSQFFTLYTVPGGPHAAAFRRRVRETIAARPDAAAVFAPIHEGPYAAPDRAFDREWIEDTFAVRLGSSPLAVAV